MRLNSRQQQAIIETFLDVFGHGEIFLFGSRVDDAKRGGDIDLYVKLDHHDHIADKRMTFLARLKRKIGDQKIDLVVAEEPRRPIDNIAQREGILLCQKH